MNAPEYDAFAETFARSRKTMEWLEIRTAVRTCSEMVPQGVRPAVLDVGCGSGRLVPALSEAFPGGFSYVGTDVSEGMLRQARKTFPDFDFQWADMRDLATFRSGAFHAVFAIASLHHLLSPEDRSRAFAEAFRVLVPDGTFALTCWNLLSESNVSKYGDRRRPDGSFGIKIGSSVRTYAALDEGMVVREASAAGFETVFSETNSRNVLAVFRKPG